MVNIDQVKAPRKVYPSAPNDLAAQFIGPRIRRNRVHAQRQIVILAALDTFGGDQTRRRDEEGRDRLRGAGPLSRDIAAGAVQKAYGGEIGDRPPSAANEVGGIDAGRAKTIARAAEPRGRRRRRTGTGGGKA